MTDIQSQQSPQPNERPDIYEVIPPPLMESLKSDAKQRGVIGLTSQRPADLLREIARHYRIAHTTGLDLFVDRVKQLGMIAVVCRTILDLNQVCDLEFSPLFQLVTSNAAPSSENLALLLGEARGMKNSWIATGLISAVARDPISAAQFNASPREWISLAKPVLLGIQKHLGNGRLFTGRHFAAAAIVLEKSHDVAHDLTSLFVLREEAVSSSAEFMRNFYAEGFQYVYHQAALAPLLPGTRIPVYQNEAIYSVEITISKYLALISDGPNYYEAQRCISDLGVLPPKTCEWLAALARRLRFEPIPYPAFASLVSLSRHEPLKTHLEALIPSIASAPAEMVPIAVTLLEDILTDLRLPVSSFVPRLTTRDFEQVAAEIVEIRRQHSSTPEPTPSLISSTSRINGKDDPRLKAAVVRASLLAAEVEHQHEQTLRMSKGQLERSIRSLRGDATIDRAQFLVRYLSCAQELLRRHDKIPLNPAQLVTLITMIEDSARSDRARTGALLHGCASDVSPSLWALLGGYHHLQGRAVDRLLQSTEAAELEYSHFRLFFESIGAMSYIERYSNNRSPRRSAPVILYSGIEDLIFGELRSADQGQPTASDRRFEVCLLDALDQQFLNRATSSYAFSGPAGWELYPSTLKKLISLAKTLPEHISKNDLALAVSSFLEGNLEARNVHPLTMALYVRDAIEAVRLRENVDYVIHGSSVVIVDRFGTGLPMPNRTWCDGLHALVAAKHGLPSPQIITPIYKTNVSSFLAKYSTLYGLTSPGTTVEELDYLQLATELRRIDLVTARGAIKAPCSTTVFETESAWFRYLERCAVEATTGSNPRALVLVVRSTADAEILTRDLGRAGRSVYLEKGMLPAEIGRSDRNRSVSHALFGAPGSVTVVTPAFLYGDPGKACDRLKANAGLHIVMTYTPRDRREEMRAREIGGVGGGVGSFEIATCLPKDALLWSRGEATRVAVTTTLNAFGPASEEIQRLISLVRGYSQIFNDRYVQSHSKQTREKKSAIELYHAALRSISKPYLTRRGALELYGDLSSLLSYIVPSESDSDQYSEVVAAVGGWSPHGGHEPSADETRLRDLFLELYQLPVDVAGMTPQESADRIAAEAALVVLDEIRRDAIRLRSEGVGYFARAMHAFTERICENTQEDLEPISRVDLARIKDFIEEELEGRMRSD